MTFHISIRLNPSLFLFVFSLDRVCISVVWPGFHISVSAPDSAPNTLWSTIPALIISLWKDFVPASGVQIVISV